MHSIESRFVIGLLIYCLEACMWALFNPEILQAGAVKGLTENDLVSPQAHSRIQINSSRAFEGLFPVQLDSNCRSIHIRVIIHYA